MAMPNLPLEIALAWFAAQPGVTPDHQAQLRAAVCADEVRLERLNRQAAAGRLNGFSLDVVSGNFNSNDCDPVADASAQYCVASGQYPSALVWVRMPGTAVTAFGDQCRLPAHRRRAMHRVSSVSSVGRPPQRRCGLGMQRS